MTLNKELLLKTAEALESGKFQQARQTWGDGQLSPRPEIQRDGFCCLHVMIAVHTQTEEFSMNAFDRIRGSADRALATDPRFTSMDRLRYCSGISGLDDGAINSLISMNDSWGKTFPEIATQLRNYASEETNEEATEA